MVATVMRDWRVDAACADHDPELFFGLTVDSVAEAVAVCQGCPVRAECRQWADAEGIAYGVWGGETEDQRRRRLAGRLPGDDTAAVCEQCQRPYRRGRPQQRFCGYRCHHASMSVGTAECGTAAGARRHRKRGEPVDAACRKAESRARTLARQRQRAEVPS